MTQGYQFWTQADTEGYFTINNIRTGVYDVYGWVPGVIGDYKYAGGSLHIQPG
jgi:rhamnogalacturonan endolyase